MLRRSRILHVLYNLRHYKQLKSNQSLYKRFGVSKSVVTSIRHNDFTKPSLDIPWLDQKNAVQELEKDTRLLTFSATWQEQIRQWPTRGYLIIPACVSSETCDQISHELKHLIHAGDVAFDYTNSRVMNAWKKSPAICAVMNDPELMRLLEFIFRRKAKPFQTINFLKGSQQRTHSDSIHMTTEPLGYLAATWIALEDLDLGSGLLHYYPGSHQLPYIMGEDFEHNSNSFAVGNDFYGNYENKIAELINEKKLQKEIFPAKKGDLLLWHANLLHGGEAITSPDSSRKSLVTHYFCEGDIVCYHEISQRPAIHGKAESCSGTL
ncbi:MAG: phytanoyl-CoA dioxygenase family protein [Bacteroidia bacterium]